MRLMCRCAVAILGITFAAPGTNPAWGQSVEQPIDHTAGPSAVAPESSALDEQIDTWIEMLDSPRYSDRVEAATSLQRLGKTAIESLRHVVLDGQVEASNRALDILRRHYLSEDPVLKNTALEALTLIADAEHPRSPLAARILERVSELEKQAGVKPAAVPFLPPLVPNLRAGNQIFAKAIAGNQRTRIQIKVVNGNKEVTVEENGKSIRVAQNGDGVEVEKTDEKGKKTKAKYKDLEELKKQDPQAHQAFQRAGGGIQIKIGGQLRPAPPQVPEELRKRRDEMLRRHDEIRKRHEELRKQHLERLEQMRRQVPANTPPPIDEPHTDVDAREAADDDQPAKPAPVVPLNV